MAWLKSPPELVDTFEAVLPSDARVERRKMFGYPCAFVNGNMFAGLHESNMLLRLPDADRERLLREPGAARFEPMPGRVMREYVVVPEAMLSDRGALQSWVTRAFRYVAALPAKPTKRNPSRGKPAARAATSASGRRRRP